MRQYFSWMTSFVLVSILLLTACQPIQLDPVRADNESPLLSTTTVHQFPADETNVVTGTLSSLKRTPEGAYISLQTHDLVPGDAYTLWWAVFNDPTNCSAGGCIPQDFIQAKVVAMVKYGVGAIADPDGTATFTAFLPVGDIVGALDNSSGFDWEVLEPAPGLLEPLTAEIHIVIRSHGAALEDPTEQLATFNGGCNPACYNVQAAMHIP